MNNNKNLPPIEIVPVVLRRTWEGIEETWKKIYQVPDHIAIDITDGIFAGDGTFREIRQFKKLPQSQKIELHMMVHTPANFVDDLIDLNPARIIFHLESFEGTHDIKWVYETLREKTQGELALGITVETPAERLEEYLPLVDYVLFLAVPRGYGGGEMNPVVYRMIGAFKDKHPNLRIAADGGVDKETVEMYVRAGAIMLHVNTFVFGQGDPKENYEQLRLLANSAERGK